jgi:hypothetical protein
MWLAVLAMASGAALVFAWIGSVPDVYDPFLAVCAAGNLAAQAALAWLALDRIGRPPAAPRTGADATRTLRALLALRWRSLAGWRGFAFADLCFVFVWAAAVLQMLLLIDPRYRDFPLPMFAVPLLATAARILSGDPPRGGGREELLAGGVLALGAIAGAVIEGAANLQSLAWTAAALVLALPYLLSLRRA